MKAISKFLILHTNFFHNSLSKPIFHPFRPCSASPSTLTKAAHLTPEELTKINLLIPRLCESNHLQEVIRLIEATLLTNPPLKTLPLPILIDRLSAEPDMTQSMALLNRLKHNPAVHSALLPINRMLLASYFKKHKFKEAMKIFDWMSRPDSPCAPEAVVYGVVVGGFCRNGKTYEALRVVRAMVVANMVPGSEIRSNVYKSLLREARIKEAQEFNEAMGSVEDRIVDVQRVVELLDQMIGNWTE